MSAPHTNVEKEAKRHRPPLLGMAGVVIFALVLLALLMVWVFATGDEPEGADRQLELGGSGEIEPAAAQ